jgi:hypothetical protein
VTPAQPRVAPLTLRPDTSAYTYLIVLKEKLRRMKGGKKERKAEADSKKNEKNEE